MHQGIFCVWLPGLRRYETVRILDRETKALFLCRKNLTDIYIYINIVHIQITGRLTELGQKSPLEYKEGTQNFIQDS